MLELEIVDSKRLKESDFDKAYVRRPGLVFDYIEPEVQDFSFSIGDRT